MLVNYKNCISTLIRQSTRTYESLLCFGIMTMVKNISCFFFSGAFPGVVVYKKPLQWAYPLSLKVPLPSFVDYVLLLKYVVTFSCFQIFPKSAFKP